MHCSSRSLAPNHRREVFYFDADAADRAVDFIEMFCRHGKGDLAGQRYELEPWQRWLCERYSGGCEQTGLANFERLLFVARKNAKISFDGRHSP